MTSEQPRGLRHMIVLLVTNLSLTAILAVLLLIFRESVVDHQIAAMAVPPGPGVRASLDAAVWSRIGTVAVIGVVYAVLIRRLRDGRRRSWFRVLVIAVVSLAVIVVNAVFSNYPTWFYAEQAVQAVVLLGLLWTATRPAVRAHFAPQPAGV